MDEQQILVAQVQEHLMRAGLYPGPANGIVGPMMHDVVRSYQRRHNLPIDGKINAALLSHMLAGEPEYSSREQ